MGLNVGRSVTDKINVRPLEIGLLSTPRAIFHKYESRFHELLKPYSAVHRLKLGAKFAFKIIVSFFVVSHKYTI